MKVECKSVDEMNDVSDDGDDDALFVESREEEGCVVIIFLVPRSVRMWLS